MAHQRGQEGPSCKREDYIVISSDDEKPEEAPALFCRTKRRRPARGPAEWPIWNARKAGALSGSPCFAFSLRIYPKCPRHSIHIPGDFTDRYMPDAAGSWTLTTPNNRRSWVLTIRRHGESKYFRIVDGWWEFVADLELRRRNAFLIKRPSMKERSLEAILFTVDYPAFSFS